MVIFSTCEAFESYSEVTLLKKKKRSTHFYFTFWIYLKCNTYDINKLKILSCVKKNVASTYIGIFTNMENLATGPGDVLLQVPKTSPLRGWGS